VDIHSVKSIEPGDKILIPFVAKPSHAGPFHQRIIFYLDSSAQHRVAADILGFCKEF
jgi:hypothetical protein